MGIFLIALLLIWRSITKRSLRAYYGVTKTWMVTVVMAVLAFVFITNGHYLDVLFPILSEKMLTVIEFGAYILAVHFGLATLIQLEKEKDFRVTKREKLDTLIKQAKQVKA